MLNVPFVNTSDANAGLQLNKDIEVKNVTASADDISAADQIWVWVAKDHGYTQFFRYAGDGVEYAAGWCLAEGDLPYIEDVEGFENGLKLGSAIYYKARSGEGKAITGSGAIEAQDEYEVAISGGNFTMFGNPYPTALKLNGDKFTVNNVTASADDISAADQIWVWVAKDHGYTQFFRYAGDGVEYAAGWCLAEGDLPYIEDVEGFENGIPSGTAMYYKARAGESKSAVFTSPLVTK